MTVAFASIQRALALFAEALLGEPARFDVDETQSASGRRPLSTLGGATTVVLPPAIEGRDDDRRAYRHAVLHQTAYELFGTRAFDPGAFVRDHPDRPGLAETFAALEECRLDVLVARRFPGARADVAAAADSLPRPPAATAASVAHLVAQGGLHRWSVTEVAELALALCPAVAAVVPLDPSELDLESDPDRASSRVELETSGGGDDPPGTLDPLLYDLDGAPGDVDDIGSGTQADGAGAGLDLPSLAPRRGVAIERVDGLDARVRAGRSSRDVFTGRRSTLYDEWDYRAGRYLPAWCRVSERPLEGGDPDFVVEVRRRHAVLARQVRRQFRRIAADSFRRRHREPDGAELDLDAVIGSLVERRRGVVDDERLQIRRERAAREVAAAFLLDMSASTSTPVLDPEAPPLAPPAPVNPDEGYPALSWDLSEPPPVPSRTVLDVAKESLALMCDALSALGDEHALYGFSGSGRDDVEFYVAKDLHEAVSSRTWARLAAMQPRRYTRMGPAIRHATRRLQRHPARVRLLVVVSDGYPQDSDYGPDRTDKHYGIADTAKALAEAARVGVETFCITVDPAGNDYLRHMCPDERYLVIDDVHQLPGELAKLYRTLTLSRR